MGWKVLSEMIEWVERFFYFLYKEDVLFLGIYLFYCEWIFEGLCGKYKMR